MRTVKSGGFDVSSAIADLSERSGIRRVHFLGWRDLGDVEAGGSEIYAAQVAEVWANAGIDIVMRTSHAQGQAGEVQRDGYRVVRRGSRHSVFPQTIIEEILRRHGPRDAVFEAWNGIPFMTPLWFRGPRLAIVHHVHKSMWPEVMSPLGAKLGWFIEGNLAPPFYRSTPMLAPSLSSRCEIVEQLGIPAANITIASPGIDRRFRPSKSKSPTPMLITVARLTATKNVASMIRISNEVRRYVPDLEYVIVGDGYERSNLEQLVDSLGARDWVRFAGRVPFNELRTLLQQAWVLASASSAEGFGMTLTEAGACATPSVATDITGHRDAIVDGATGLLATDDADFATKVVGMFTDFALRARFSKNALAHASRFTWEQTALTAFESISGLKSATPTSIDANNVLGSLGSLGSHGSNGSRVRTEFPTGVGASSRRDAMGDSDELVMKPSRSAAATPR